MKPSRRREMLVMATFLFFGAPLICLWALLTSEHPPLQVYVALVVGPLAGVTGFFMWLRMPAEIGPCSYCTLPIPSDGRAFCKACKSYLHATCAEGHDRVYHTAPTSPESR